MSILSSLYHHAIRNKPNDVHNEPEPSEPHRAGTAAEECPAHSAPAQHAGPQAATDGSAVLTASAEKRKAAHAEAHTRPALYYTEQEQKPCANGVWESPHTVASRLESKEEYPQG